MRKHTLSALVLALVLAVSFAVPAFAKTTIVYESYSPTEVVMDAIVEQFEKDNPDIEVETIMHANATEYFSAVQIAFASGEGPDVFQYDTPTTLAQLSSQIQTLDEYCVAQWGENWKDQFVSSAISDNTIDGKLYGLPCPAAPAGTLWYNKTLLDEAGVEPPTDYASLKAAADALRAGGRQPLLIGAKDTWINIDMFQVILNDFAPGLQYEAYAGNASFTDPRVVDAFAMWKKLFDEGIFQDSAYSMTTYMDSYTQFNEMGIAGMWCNGAWNMDMYTNADIADDVAKYEWGVSLFPDLNGDGQQPGLLSVNGGYAINVNSEKKEAAWKLVEAMGCGVGAVKEIERGMAPSPYLNLAPTHFNIPDNGVRNLATINELTAVVPMQFRGIASTKVTETLSESLEALAYGQITPEEAAAKVDAAIKG